MATEVEDHQMLRVLLTLLLCRILRQRCTVHFTNKFHKRKKNRENFAIRNRNSEMILSNNPIFQQKSFIKDNREDEAKRKKTLSEVRFVRKPGTGCVHTVIEICGVRETDYPETWSPWRKRA